MSPISPLLIFFFFNFFLSVHVAFDGDEQQQQQKPSEMPMVKLDVMHRHHPHVQEKLYGERRSLGSTDRFRDIHEHDHNRQRSISTSMKMSKTDRQLPMPSSAPIQLKISSGFDFGTNEYFVQFRVGTPPQKFLLIVDTGSDLTWLKCRYRRCLGNCTAHAHHKSRVEHKVKFDHPFLANHSSSFKLITCGSDFCLGDLQLLFAIPDCQVPSNPCVYDYSYIGGGAATGLFANETVTVGLTNGKEKQLHDTLIGCTELFNAMQLKGVDGILGLGTGAHSFAHRAALDKNGGGFSYCLIDHLSHHSATSYFILGYPPAEPLSVAPVGNMTFINLHLGGPFNSYYGVGLIGISIDGVTLNIPPRVWDIQKGGGTILDSGTSLSMLTAPAFDVFMEAMVQKLKKFQQILADPFAYCFNKTHYSHEMAPKLRFHFEKGVVFEPPPKSYIVKVDDILCLGFTSIPFPDTNIIGNILQQNFLWQFDFFNKKVGFAPSQCI
ncbi:aspartic proteinase NANA, chloroplast-like isoform X2 [Cucurbita moschata]|nr:aspartic proteinase NANA, chloroplast-like isoform X2 [Cucurbita moschata]